LQEIAKDKSRKHSAAEPQNKKCQSRKHEREKARNKDGNFKAILHFVFSFFRVFVILPWVSLGNLHGWRRNRAHSRTKEGKYETRNGL
jgi:hypothetical protein